jgi:hypothetical protein
MGMDAGKQCEYLFSGSVQRCLLDSGTCEIQATGQRFNCIGEYRISGRTHGLRIGLQVECGLGFLFGLVWFGRMNFIDRRSRVGVLKFSNIR